MMQQNHLHFCNIAHLATMYFKLWLQMALTKNITSKSQKNNKIIVLLRIDVNAATL